MAVPRALGAPGRTVFRRAATQTRSQAWRQIGRRNYASEHGQKSSELPWIIGSAAVTIPAAVWLLGQGPQKGVHHPEKAHAEREEGEKDIKEPAEEAYEAKPGATSPSIDSAQDPKDEKESTQERQSEPESDDSGDSDESKEDSPDEASDDSSDEGKESGEDKTSPNAPGQINHDPGEQQTGQLRASELQSEKGSKKDESGAKNPYLESDEKSKKAQGLKDTMKIHGTVDPSQPLRGPKGPGQGRD